MRILLPPSEAKVLGGRGKPLQGRTRRIPLQAARDEVFRALSGLLERGPDLAARALALPPSVAGTALAENRAALRSPTMPAIERYSGVVYEGLAIADVDPASRRAADRDVLIFSGLFGVSRGGDPIPAYRVPGKAVLPGIGVAATFWRERLSPFVESLLDGELIVDLRSSDYAAMWRPAVGGPFFERVLIVRILSPRPDGSLGVISFASKFYKGVLARGLLSLSAGGATVREPEQVAQTWLGLGGKDAVIRTAGPARTIELIAHTSTIRGTAPRLR